MSAKMKQSQNGAAKAAAAVIDLARQNFDKNKNQ